MKYNNVVLVSPNPFSVFGVNEATLYPPLGLAYIASVLRNNGINVTIIDANVYKLSTGEVLEKIRSLKPGIVGLSLNICNAKSAFELSKAIKNNTDALVCLGGPFTSSLIKSTIIKSGADLAVSGEGEMTFLELCRDKKLSEIEGIAYRKDGEIIINKPRPVIENIDNIPVPAYDLLPPFPLYYSRARKTPVAPLFSSRGCPYSCTFCNKSIFGKGFRVHSPERVFEEIKLLTGKYGIKQIDVLDDNFTYDIERAEKIFDLVIKNNIKVLFNFQNGIRIDNLTYPFVQKMKKAGVFKLGIGCESGSDAVLKRIIKKLDKEKVKLAIKWFKKEGIITYSFFIIGFPFETKENINETIDFALESDPSKSIFSVLIPFPGTQMYEEVKRDGLLLDAMEDGITDGYLGKKMYHRCTDITHEDLSAMQKAAYKRFYFRLGKIVELLSQIRSLAEIRWHISSIKSVLPLLRRRS